MLFDLRNIYKTNSNYNQVKKKQENIFTCKGLHKQKYCL